MEGDGGVPGSSTGTSSGTCLSARLSFPSCWGERIDLPVDTDVESTLKLITGNF